LVTASPILFPSNMNRPETGSRIQTKEMNIKKMVAKPEFHFLFTKKTIALLHKT
jgi:hypothetical protein